MNAQETLQESENTFRSIFELVNDGIMIADGETRGLIEANKAICAMLGYSRDEIVKLSVDDIHPINDLPAVRELLEKQLGGEIQIAPDVPMLRKDGSVFFADISASPVTFGGKQCLAGIFRNTTRRKMAMEALAASEEKYRVYFENATDVIFSVDPGLRLLSISPSVERALGYKPEELIGKAVGELNITAPASLVKAASDIRRVLAGERIENSLYEYRAKDDTKRFGEVNASPFFHDGKVVAATCVSRDITERKRVEDELQGALEQYRSLAANVDSMYLVDKDGTYLFMNEGHLKRFGLSLEEVIGKKYSELHSEEESRLFAKDIGEIISTGQSSTKEHHSARDGRYFLRTFSPIKGKDDAEISQVAIISKDISDIKSAEKQLKQTSESLRRAIGTIIQVMVAAVEARDPYTAGHQVRSANLARAIAAEMQLPLEKTESIRMAGSIHDIGKLSIPAEILSKPTKLSELEFALIKEHAQRGFEILKDVESPWPLAEIVRQHHERMDGSGYPGKLKGEQICLEARILAVSDVVESMASHRPYRPSLGIEAALAEIENNRGILYDNAVADACLKLFREKGFQLTGA